MAIVHTLTPEERARRQAARLRALGIRPGDRLTPDPLYNRTTRDSRHRLPSPCIVRATRFDQCQTGVMVTVNTRDAGPVTLDAGWFLEYQ